MWVWIDVGPSRNMRLLLRFAATLLVLGFHFASGQTLKYANVKGAVSGYCYAVSAYKDPEAAGGFAEYGARPRMLPEKMQTPRGVELHIDTTKDVAFENELHGYRMYLANRTPDHVGFFASDSRIKILAQVFYEDKWRTIEYFPSSWCGNSYHHVFLRPYQAWVFVIPQYRGAVPVKLRYRCDPGNGKFIYSNVIHASFNPEQLVQKMPHKPDGIMDPYLDESQETPEVKRIKIRKPDPIPVGGNGSGVMSGGLE